MTKRLLTAPSPSGARAVKRAPAKPPDVGSEGDHALADLTADAAGIPDAGLPSTSRRLLEAAVDSFAERGFHATTTRDIATRAGLSPAGLYVHYPSKSALLGHLSRVGHQAALRLVERTLALPGDSPRRLHALVAAFVAWHAQHHTVARVVQYELRSLDPDDREVVTGLRRELERRVEQEVRRGVDAGTLTTAHPRQATRAILSLAVDVARWFDPAGTESPERLGRIYADLALRMLGGEPFDVAETDAPDDEEESP